MATITSPIILDSTGQDIVTKLNAISTNLNKTASDIPYDANLTIKGKIDADNSPTTRQSATQTGLRETKLSNGVSIVNFNNVSLSNNTTLDIEKTPSTGQWNVMLDSSSSTFIRAGVNTNKQIVLRNASGTTVATATLLGQIVLV